jgi:hypothetical protein
MKKSSSKISRRDLLKSAAVTGASLGLNKTCGILNSRRGTGASLA